MRSKVLPSAAEDSQEEIALWSPRADLQARIVQAGREARGRRPSSSSLYVVFSGGQRTARCVLSSLATRVSTLCFSNRPLVSVCLTSTLLASHPGPRPQTSPALFVHESPPA